MSTLRPHHVLTAVVIALSVGICAHISKYTDELLEERWTRPSTAAQSKLTTRAPLYCYQTIGQQDCYQKTLTSATRTCPCALHTFGKNKLNRPRSKRKREG